MKRMLINARQPEELRVALVDGQDLIDVDIETPSSEKKKSNIYKGRIIRIEPSLDAAFVDYDGGRHGFLPFKEIAREYLDLPSDGEGGDRPLNEAIRTDQELIVQVEKEERGTKGAALTTFVSLAGRYLVLMPNNPRAGGISRRVEGEERAELREALSGLEIPTGLGLIVRTAGVGRTREELQIDVDYLLRVWAAIQRASRERPAPFLIYQESNIVIRALRDHFRQDIGEVLVDTQGAHDQARDFMSLVMPDSVPRLKLYKDRVPLFSRYQIESRIEAAFEHKVRLPSGGSLVIDHTEALVSIDINSARATKGADIEQTALQTNLEAADEIARQLRIRDIGGLIVIDFIDMTPVRHQREVENRFKEAVQTDRARIQIGRISHFGLLEMSRQRLRPSLDESSYGPCPRCNGRGYIRNTESLALSVLRLLAGEAMKERTGRVVANLPIEVATYLLNEKRGALKEIEDRSRAEIIVIPDPGKSSPDFSIERVRGDDRSHASHQRSSYDLTSPVEAESKYAVPHRTPSVPEPAVRHVPPPPAQPKPEKDHEPGGFTRLQDFLAGLFKAKDASESAPERPPRRTRTPAAASHSRRRGSRPTEGEGRRRDESRRGEEVRRRSRPERRADAGGTAKTTAQAQSSQRSRPRPIENDSGSRSGGRGGRRDGPGHPRGPASTRSGSNSRGSHQPAASAQRAPASPGPVDAAAPVPDGEEGPRRSRTRRGRRGGRRYRRPETSATDASPAVEAKPEAGRSEGESPLSTTVEPSRPALAPRSGEVVAYEPPVEVKARNVASS